jgi:NADH:ubiquinone oxidoreductase subunit 2 (subunit N)
MFLAIAVTEFRRFFAFSSLVMLGFLFTAMTTYSQAIISACYINILLYAYFGYCTLYSYSELQSKNALNTGLIGTRFMNEVPFRTNKFYLILISSLQTLAGLPPYLVFPFKV